MLDTQPKRIDGIRRQIKAWHDERLLSEVEHAVLLHDLMLAANKVANTAGTYGHFLSRVSQSARHALEIVPSLASPEPFPEGHVVIHDDALNTAHQVAADVFYLDPPYTKRQYAAYYHILETIAHQDHPALVGKSGLRPWEDRASDFCYKRRAPLAMKALLDGIDARYVFVSYSDDGHIAHEEMLDLLATRGAVTCEGIRYPRYHSHSHLEAQAVKERLYRVETN